MGCNKETDNSDLNATSKNKTPTTSSQSNQDHSADPVNMVTGAFTLDETDCRFPSQRLWVEVTRYYDSEQHNKSNKLSPFGWGWTHSLNLYLEIDPSNNHCIYVDDRGVKLIFKFDLDSKQYLSPPGAVGLNLKEKDGGGFSLRQIDGLIAEFNELGHLTAMIRPGPISDSKIKLSYDDENRLIKVDGIGGRYIRFFYNGKGPLIRSITDHTGREWRYKYDRYNNLVQVNDPSDRVRAYSYGYEKVQITNDDGEIEPREIRGLHKVYKYTFDEREKVAEVTNYYTSDYRVCRQVDAQDGVTRFEYNRFTRMTYLTDPAGWTFVYCYDKAGNTTKVRLPEGATTEYIFDERRNLLAEIDPLGNRTEYVELHDPKLFDKQLDFGRRALGNRSDYLNISADDIVIGYDEMGNRAMMRDPLGNVYRYLDYTPFGKPGLVILPTGTEIRYEYDERSGLPLRMERQLIVGKAKPLKSIQEWEYDDIGNVTHHCEWTEDNEGALNSVRTSRVVYDEYGHHPIRQLSWSGEKQRAIFPGEERFLWDELGRLVKHQVVRRNTADDKHPAVLTTQFGYDVLDRRICEITPSGTAVCTIYDIDDNVIETFMTQDFTPQNPTEVAETERNERHQWTYDIIGNEIQHIDPAGLITKQEWDERGLCICTTEPTGFATEYEYDRDGKELLQRTSLGYEVETTYDATGRAIVQKSSSELELYWEYDALGQVVKELQIVNGTKAETSYVYDQLGRLVEITKTEGISERFEYDEQGNVVRREKASDPLYIEEYAYDGGGRPVEIKAGTEDNLHTQFSYRYDDVSRLIETYDALGNVTREFYDSSGNLVRKVDAEGRELCLHYDEMGQLISRHASDHSVDAKLQYDFVGRLVKAREGPVVYKWQYDAGGSLVQYHQELGDKVYSMAYEYDQAGRLVRKQLDDQWWMGFAYKARTPFVSQVKIPGHVVDLLIDEQGRVLKECWLDGGRTEYVYEPDGAITSLSILDDDDRMIFEQQFTYDIRRRPKNETRTLQNTSTKYQYHYDSLDRLVQVERGSNGLLNEYLRYEYDIMGNRVAEYHEGQTFRTYRYDLANRLSQQSNSSEHVIYEYDRCGNLIGKGNIKYSYDVEQRLRQINLIDADGEAAQFEYAATGQQACTRSLDGVEWLVNENYHEIRSESQVGKRNYFWRDKFDSSFAVQLCQTQDVKRVYSDAFESVISYEGNGDFIDYDPFGISSLQLQGLPFGFSGKRYDNKAKLYCNRARWYEPTSGRFTQPDPLGIADSVNIYLFTNNNPVTFSDPWGLKSVKSAQGAISQLLEPGHLVEKHVGKTILELHQRLAAEPNIPHASSFTNLATTKNVVAKAIGQNESKITNWLTRSSSGSRTRIEYSGKSTIGIMVSRSSPSLSTATNARIILERDTSNFGFHVLTGFPVP